MIRNFLLLVGITGVLLSSCNTVKKTIIIGPDTQPCTAGMMQKECMQVKWTKEQPEWQNFFNEIDGFTYEKGYEYELVVSEKKVENPPAGGSSLQYKLVKEISKTKVEVPDNTSGHTSQNALDWAGTYQGTLPCADCDGIKTTITLHSDATFHRTQEYLGKNAKPFTDNGKIEWDKNGAKISLIDNKTNQKYQVGENLLFHLDNAGNQITGSLKEKYILAKIETENTANNAGFEDKKWTLINFMGKDVKENAVENYITFNSKEKKLNTKVGCNVMNASYELTNQLNLKIGPMMSTMMACPENSMEDEYKTNLGTVTNITTNGELLHLNRARMIIATYKLVK